MLAKVGREHPNETLGGTDVTLRDAVGLRDVRHAEGMLDSRDLLHLVPDKIVILTSVVRVDGFWRVEPTHKANESDGDLQSCTETGAKQNSKLRGLANEYNKLVEASECACGHGAARIQMPSSEGSSMQAQ